MFPDVKRKHLYRASLALNRSLVCNSQKGIKQVSWEGTSPLALSFDVYSRRGVRDSAVFAPKEQEHQQAGLGTAWEGGRRAREAASLCPGMWERRNGEHGPCLHRVLINLGHNILLQWSALATDPQAVQPCKGHDIGCSCKSTRSEGTAEPRHSATSGSVQSRFRC